MFWLLLLLLLLLLLFLLVPAATVATDAAIIHAHIAAVATPAEQLQLLLNASVTNLPRINQYMHSAVGNTMLVLS